VSAADPVMVVALVAAAGVVLAAAALLVLRRRYDTSLRRLRHFLEGHLHDGPGPELPIDGPAEVRALARVAADVVRRPATQPADPDATVVVELLSHLPGPLVVCAGDGRVALANDAATALVPAAALVPGRSVFAALDRRDLEPALVLLREEPRAWLPVAVRVVGTDHVLPLRVAAVPPVTGFVLLGEPARDVHPPPGPRPRFSDLSVLRAPPLAPTWADRPLDEVVATVLDCETTGLDPSVDAVVSVAAVHVVRRRVADDVLDRLVDPGRPIPRTATGVHGLADADIAGQPPLAHVVPELRRFAAESVVVGHDVGFDLAFLGAAGFTAPGPVLDTLLLAEVAQPGAEGYSLDDVASRLGVVVEGRHSALGDAITTARVLVALLPLLQRAGVRTVGEAVRACTESPSAKAMSSRPWAEGTRS
jgi:DNA polymerase-3 subunit epsilon